MDQETKTNEKKDFFTKEPLRLKEKKDHSLWYWLIALLILLLFAWYGYSAGWFTKKASQIQEKTNMGSKMQKQNTHENDANISNIVIKTSEGFPVEKTLVVKGTLPDGCTYLNEPQVMRSGNTFYVNLTTRREGDMCTEAVKNYEIPIVIPVQGLPAGNYVIVINGKQLNFELEQDNKLDYTKEGK